MIMDIANQRSNISAHSTDTISVTKPNSLKRSFDVAFLMMPDDRLRQKQQQQQLQLHQHQHQQESHQELIEKQSRLDVESLDSSPSPPPMYPKDLSPRQLIQNDIVNPDFFNNTELRRYPQIAIRSPRRIYDDPTILPEIDSVQKSAFTKVSRLESPIPPQPSLSPDQLSCPSMSPPISTTPPRNSSNSSLSSPPNGFYTHFRPEYHLNGAFHSVGQVQALAAQNIRIKQQFMYRPANSTDLIPGYLTPGFPFSNNGNNSSFVPQSDVTRNPAAAVLTALIPPTIASTFSLTAQNVCAKCNISFRMTSDLVYHMRSHHKSEVASDPNRRKRQEKLKCPVCNESFRERHHLTRHMTAHQDKASDDTDVTNSQAQQHQGHQFERK